MKRSWMYVLILIFLAITIGYYFLFIKERRVNQFQLINIVDKEDSLQITTKESAKYISDISTNIISDTIMKIELFTTTIYNPFSKRRTEVNINIGRQIRSLVVAGHQIQR
jgi:hypothetical protein